MFSKFTEKASSYASTAAAAANATYETGKQGLSSVPCDRCGVPHNALLRLSTCPVCGGRLQGLQRAARRAGACAKSGAGSSGEDLASGAAGETYPRPGAAVADTGASATAMRLAPLALEALKLSGYSDVVAYQLAEGGIAAVLLTPTFRIFAERVLPMLRRHVRDAGEATSYKTRGAAEAELALRLYYLACGDAVGRLRACGAPREATRRGPAASDDVLDALGCGLGAAEMGVSFRDARSVRFQRGASRRGDEAVLAIRGSQTPGDWAINSDADEAPVFRVDSAWVARGGILRPRGRF
ncbi:hypothetical protein JL722_15099 [Aureococcus anophagefferens]|nr:hypothetical protein JL722_15099 [Aureococcus anophagefferens]